MREENNEIRRKKCKNSQNSENFFGNYGVLTTPQMTPPPSGRAGRVDSPPRPPPPSVFRQSAHPRTVLLFHKKNHSWQFLNFVLHFSQLATKNYRKSYHRNLRRDEKVEDRSESVFAKWFWDFWQTKHYQAKLNGLLHDVQCCMPCLPGDSQSTSLSAQ